ncbi:MAG: mechanosensitive ion channel family protein [Litorimonas sp.]
MDIVLTYWELAKEQFPFLLTLGGNILAALLIFSVGLSVGRRLSNRLRKSRFGGTHLDATLRPVMASVVFYVILAMTLYAVLIKLGVPATALVAVFGAAGLAIGLALRDTLSNIAAGVMLLILRPIKVGDFVDIGQSTVGSVEEIGLFTSTIRNVENVAVYLPNSLVWGNRVQNFGRHARRRAIVEIGVAYDTDLDAARALLLDVLAQQPDMIPHDPTGVLGAAGAPTPPEVYVMGFGDSAINLSCRCWLPGDNWLMRASNLRMSIKRALDGADIEIPFPQRVVHMATPD